MINICLNSISSYDWHGHTYLYIPQSLYGIYVQLYNPKTCKLFPLSHTPYFKLHAITQIFVIQHSLDLHLIVWNRIKCEAPGAYVKCLWEYNLWKSKLRRHKTKETNGPMHTLKRTKKKTENIKI